MGWECLDAMQGRPHDAGRLLRVQNGGRGDRISGGHRPMTACALSRVVSGKFRGGNIGKKMEGSAMLCQNER